MRGVKSYFVLLILVVFASCWAPYAKAGCTGSSPTWNSTIDSSSLQMCVNNATAGDTINVAAGTATYSSPVNVTKNVSIIGAGIGSSIINGVPFAVSGVTASGSTVSVRISGFTFNFGGGQMYITDAVNFRFDHDAFNNANAAADATCVETFSTSSGNIVSGLFDHITSSYCQFEELGGDFNGVGGTGNMINVMWSTASPVGSASNIFFENSTFTNVDPSAGGYFNCWDAHRGGRYVIRFSTLDGCRVEAHGVQADNDRATRSWEAYNNSIVNTHGANGYWPFSQRGGTGMIFHNTMDANWLQPYMRIDSPRLDEDSISGQVPTWQFCDGTNKSTYYNGSSEVQYGSNKSVIVDNAGSTGGTGYRCLDQIGTGAQSSTWTNMASAPPSQALAPVYVWKNTLGGSEMPVSPCCEEGSVLWAIMLTNIVQNRDYYLYNASFNGTTGVGEGTLASRPSSCTTGVGYWATDQGSWNSSGSGGQGRFYQCTATNTWTLYYTPYTYPHPLQGSSGAAQVAPPTSLNAIVNTIAQ